MQFDEMDNLQPDFLNDGQRDPKLVDLSLLKKGMPYVGHDKGLVKRQNE
jgi:hypothetical protein